MLIKRTKSFMHISIKFTCHNSKNYVKIVKLKKQIKHKQNILKGIIIYLYN